jgi:ComF family protein
MSQANRLKVEVSGLGGRLLDLLFPARCVSCKQIDSALCENCLSTVHWITTPTCVRCGYPLSHIHADCPECRAHPLTITRIQSAVWHDGAVREAILALKYKRRRDVARSLAQFVAHEITKSNIVFDLITSVPLHPTRELERGYNQAELVALHVADICNLGYRRVLKRTRATSDQIGLDGRARRLNVQNAFQAEASQVERKIVLVIDDVSTTGATLDACAAALFQAHAHLVYGMTVARPRGS